MTFPDWHTADKELARRAMELMNEPGATRDFNGILWAIERALDEQGPSEWPNEVDTAALLQRVRARLTPSEPG